MAIASTSYKISRFGLLRHAQTVWNREKRIQGQCDSPLTLEGERQALRWGRVLKPFSWDRILASDLGRAVQTADLINTALKTSMATDGRLREQDWGRWTGKTLVQLKNEAQPELELQVAGGWNFCPPGGESRRQVLRRSLNALETAAATWPGQNILVVAHEGVVKSLIYHIRGRRFLPEEPAILKPNCLHRLVCRNGKLQIDQLNALELSGGHMGNLKSRAPNSNFQ